MMSNNRPDSALGRLRECVEIRKKWMKIDQDTPFHFTLKDMEEVLASYDALEEAYKCAMRGLSEAITTLSRTSRMSKY